MTDKKHGLNTMTTGELQAWGEQQDAEWRQTRRIGRAEYDPEINVIKLYVYGGRNAYEVDLDRCETPNQLANWLVHLAGKTWCKDGLLDEFIHCLNYVVEEKHGKDLWAFFKLND